MTFPQPSTTPPRPSNQAASLISPTPVVHSRSSSRFWARRGRARRERNRVPPPVLTRAARRAIAVRERELRRLKKEIRFNLDVYKNLVKELRTLREGYGPFSKHHTHFDSTSREAHNLACPPSYSSFNSKTKRAHRQARRANLFSQPAKRHRTR
jgi:hypothetical protein